MNIKDVENLAELSRIELPEDEKKGILADMEGILKYVKVIESVKVENVEPDYKIHNIWREDSSNAREFSKEMILEQFPDSKDNFLKVKKII